jgi:hypothetical protein
MEKISDELIAMVVLEHPESKDALKKLFPKYFKGEYLEFGKHFELGTDDTQPIYIANNFAKGGDEHKVLLVNKNYSLEIIENYHEGKTGIKIKNA